MNVKLIDIVKAVCTSVCCGPGIKENGFPILKTGT